MMKKLKHKLSGFTIVELIIVIAIIGILSSLVYNGIRSTQANARDAERKVDAEIIQRNLETYYIDNSNYPSENIIGSELPSLFPEVFSDPFDNKINESSDYSYSGISCLFDQCIGFRLDIALERENDLIIFNQQ